MIRLTTRKMILYRYVVVIEIFETNGLDHSELSPNRLNLKNYVNHVTFRVIEDPNPLLNPF